MEVITNKFEVSYKAKNMMEKLEKMLGEKEVYHAVITTERFIYKECIDIHYKVRYQKWIGEKFRTVEITFDTFVKL